MVTKSDRWVSLCTLVSTNVDHIHEHKHKCNTQIVENIGLSRLPDGNPAEFQVEATNT